MNVGMKRLLLAVCLVALTHAAALARGAFRCAGFAQAGGAEMLCSHTDPDAPAQICSFSWTLMTTANQQSVVNGSFLLARGMTNVAVYQGSGFAYTLSSPVVLCQGRKDG